MSGLLSIQISLRVRATLFTAMMVLLAPAGANAQFSESYSFLEAVKKKEGDKVEEALLKTNNRIVTTKDNSTGETALHIVAARRDLTWLAYLIGKGAEVNAHDSQGRTPLQVAANLGWRDGVQYLLQNRATPDETNDAGETPLITAVHLQDPDMVKLLLEAGADPDRADNSGRSARDYATVDGMSSRVRDAIAAVQKKTKAAKAVYGPQL